MTRVDLLAQRSPAIEPEFFEGRGLGGNENTMILWARELVRAGHEVGVYCNGQFVGVREGVAWGRLHERPSGADLVVSFRDPEPLRSVEHAVRVLFLGDRETPGFETALSDGVVDAVYCTSRHQYERYRATAPVHHRAAWLLGACGYDCDLIPGPAQKAPGTIVYASAPYRGLRDAIAVWQLVRQLAPHSQLFVTGGYELWGYTRDEATALTERDIGRQARAVAGLNFVGPLPRRRYASLLRSAEVFLYPTAYEEMFCIAALEATAAGAVPVVSPVGALSERVVDGETGILVTGDPSRKAVRQRFAVEVARLLSDDTRRQELADAAARSARDLCVRHVVSRLLDQLSLHGS